MRQYKRLIEPVIDGVTSTSVYNGDGLRVSHMVSGVTTDYIWDVATLLRVTGVGTIVGIVLDEIGDLFAPTLPGEKPPACSYHSP